MVRQSEASGSGVDLDNLAPSDGVIDTTVMRDFYLSFRFTQGDPYVQKASYGLLAAYYCRDFTTIDRSSLVARFDSLANRAAALKLPRSHKDSAAIAAEHEAQHMPSIADFFRREWGQFSRIQRHTFANPEASRRKTNRDAPIARFAAKIALADNEYQLRDRPGSNQDNDPHFSLFRSHIVLGHATGSNTFDSIFGRAQSLLDKPEKVTLQRSVTTLANSWETMHPGQSFFPADTSEL